MAANATSLAPDYIGMVNQQIAQNNSFSAEQAMKQMQFQERMSNTAHQREVKDLKAAGLNPVLSANQGASTPSGSAASADPGATSALVNMLGTMIQTESDNAKAKLQAETSKANAKLRSESSAKALEAKDWQQNLVLQYLLALTGQQGHSAAQIASDAAENTKALAKATADKVVDFAKAVVDTVVNPSKETKYEVKSNLKSDKAKETTTVSDVLKTIVQGVKNRAAYATPDSLIGKAQAKLSTASKSSKRMTK